MMMTQPFPAHQGIPQHPGLPPGHPMAQAQHPNATHMGVQPGAGMVQQIHPGVSAAGPQVSQPGPMMAGMPPGSGTTGPGGPGPNAHALSHLNPAQAHLFQQQQFAQNYANNPQMMHHQQMMRQRQIMLQQQAAQQQHGGIPVSLPAGTQGLNAAQLAAMQQANPNMRPVNMMHLQQQMPHGQTPNLQQQQHLFAMQQAHQANNAAQQGQQTPQQRPTVPPQSVTPQPQQGPPAPQGSATPQQQQQSNPQQHSTPQSQPQAQPQHTPNPQHQQIPQSQQPPPQQQQQQQPQQNQQQQQLQQAQSQQQNNQQQQAAQQAAQQQQQNQQNQQQQQQQQQLSAQEAQLKAQQQNALLMQQRANANPKGALIAYINVFSEHLNNFTSRGEANDLAYWQQFVDRFYSGTGVLRQAVFTPQNGSSKSFEVLTPILPRYYYTLFTNGIRRIQTHMETARERDLPNGNHVVESPKTSFIYWFSNDCQLFVNGSLRAVLDHNNKIEMLDLSVSSYNEYIPRSQLHPQEPVEPKQSPRVSKNVNKRAQQKQPIQPTHPHIILPESLVNGLGIPPGVQSFLEIAETLSQMTTLFSYSMQNPQLTPMDALRSLTQQMGNAYAQQAMNPAFQQAQGQRTPIMNGPSQFASPSVAQLGLPGAQGSPHIGNSAHASPAQAHIAGPIGLVPQNQAAVGANGNQGPGAKTSPNVSSKRRRASTVKTEGDDGGGAEVNGTGAPGAGKVKASPRVGGKRQKGTT